jgi:hypothetical protein
VGLDVITSVLIRGRQEILIRGRFYKGRGEGGSVMLEAEME